MSSSGDMTEILYNKSAKIFSPQCQKNHKNMRVYGLKLHSYTYSLEIPNCIGLIISTNENRDSSVVYSELHRLFPDVTRTENHFC